MSSENSAPKTHEKYNTDRLMAFTDGVIAICIAFVNVHISTYVLMIAPIPFIYLFQKSKPLF